MLCPPPGKTASTKIHCPDVSRILNALANDFVRVMRSLSLSGSPLSCSVLRLGETVRHSLRALHSFNVISLERIAGIFLLKLDLRYLLSASPEAKLAWCVLLIAMWCRCLLMDIELRTGGQSVSFSLSPLKSSIPLLRFILTAGRGTDSCLAQANS